MSWNKSNNKTYKFSRRFWLQVLIVLFLSQPRINEAFQWARGKNGRAKSGDETRRRATFVARLVPRSSFRASFFVSRLTDCCSLSIRDFFLIFRARFFYTYIFIWGSKRAAFLPAMVSTLVANCEVRENVVWLCKVQTLVQLFIGFTAINTYLNQLTVVDFSVHAKCQHKHTSHTATFTNKEQSANWERQNLRSVFHTPQNY